MSTEASQYGLRQDYWESLPQRDRDLYTKVRPLRSSTYSVDVPLAYIEKHLDRLSEDAQASGGALELNPDFQRGHVWDTARQAAYVENLLRGVAPTVLRFNCAGWDGRKEAGDLNPGDIVCVDGLQRLTAVRDFLAGKFTIFGQETAETLKGTQFDVSRMSSYRLTMQMFDITWRKQLLQFYLDINRGGVVHSEEELSRVEKLMDKAGEIDMKKAQAFEVKSAPEKEDAFAPKPRKPGKKAR